MCNHYTSCKTHLILTGNFRSKSLIINTTRNYSNFKLLQEKRKKKKNRRKPPINLYVFSLFVIIRVMRKVLPLNEEYFLVQTFKFVGVFKFLQNHEVVEHEKKNSNLLSSTSQRAMLHKVTTNNPQNKLARIKTFLLFNLSLSDDTFDTFSSLLLLYPLETHALQTFISFLLPRPYYLLRCFFCLFFCGQIHFRAVVKHCFMAQQNMLVVNTRQIMNWF